MQERLILVVDDEPPARKLLTVNLKARGYDVLTAADGGEALSLVAEHPVALVLLDLGLPDVDGLTVMETLHRGESPPVIVISARSGVQDEAIATALGAVAYFTKPFNLAELLARVRALVPPSGEDDGRPSHQ
jgi:two-component system KDP operon response regulator KdpE